MPPRPQRPDRPGKAGPRLPGSRVKPSETNKGDSEIPKPPLGKKGWVRDGLEWELPATILEAMVAIPMRTIFVPRNTSNAQTLRRKTRKARWTIASLGLTFAGTIGAASGNIQGG